MTITIILFFIAITAAFLMLSFRAWEIRTNRMSLEEENITYERGLSFKSIEKITLFLIKHTIQWIVLFCVKVWFLITTKTKIWIQNKIPKLNKYFSKEPKVLDPRKISFVQRAIIESKIKIKKVKESIKKEHEEEIQKIEVDKII